MMKPISLLLFVFLASLNSTFSQSESLKVMLEESVRSTSIVGASAGILKDGEVKNIEAAGFLNKKEGILFKNDTKTRIASISKPITAVCIFQLVEKGKIELDAKIQTYLPWFPEKEKGPISVRQLLQHTAGIPGYLNLKAVNNTTHYNSLKDAIGVFKDRELTFPPGISFQYSTYGYVILGAIIEAASGMSYEDYVTKNVFEKAGMSNSGIEMAEKAYENKSLFYEAKKKNKAKLSKPTDLSDRVPGGGFYSTAEDLLLFAKALMEGKLVSEKSITQMWTDSGMKTEGNPYGMGWFLYGENPKYGDVYGHSGSQVGASTFLYVLPDVKTAVVVLSNTSQTYDEVAKIAIQLFDIAGDL
ncbi:MAG: serine hydrolase domain-containing protein [Saprospiraceae bacterium]